MHRYVKNSYGDSIRSPDSFAAFKPIDGVDPNELSCWISLTEVHTVSALEWTWTEDWSVGPRTVEDSMWFSFLRGKGTGWIGSPKTQINYSDGDMVLIPQGIPHQITPDRRSRARVIAVHFHARVFGVFNLLSVLQFPQIIHDSRTVHHVSVSERLAREFAVRPPAWQTAMDIEVRSLLISFLRHLGSSSKLQVEGSSLKDLMRFKAAFELIEKNLANPDFSVRDMASAVYLSEVQFRKIFHRLTGVKPDCLFAPSAD